MNDSRPVRTHPATWVPTLYFAEGLPFFAVNILALTFYRKLDVSNSLTTVVVSLLAWPWTLKPLWSPLLEMYRTKKFFVVLTQLLAGLSLILLALSLNMPDAFRYSVAILAVVSFCSATHDIAADGLYITSLSSKEQARYAGWQGAFYNVARFFSVGGLIVLAGYLQERFVQGGVPAPMVRAWMIIFAILGLILVGLCLYHARWLPPGGEERRVRGLRDVGVTFRDVVVTFFEKPGIWLLLFFIFLYRTGEGQVEKVGPLFLQSPRETGGLGLSLKEFGTIYGTFGTGAFIAGSVVGGYFAAWLGLRRALPWLVCILNFPMLTYWYLSVALPTSHVVITAALVTEMFGYGFGYLGIILLMMQEIAPGKYQTAHYAFANSLMNLGLILPGAVSGWIQSQLGYPHFFLWVVASTIPALVLSRFIPIRGAGEPVR